MLITPHAKAGDTGTISAVNIDSGDIAVELESGANIIVNWGRGDRWMVIPASVAATV